MKGFDKLKEALSSPKKVVIIPHVKPDGDALGSCLGWRHYLVKQGHDVKIVSPTIFPDFLGWLPEADNIWIHEDHTKQCEDILEKADVIFCLDFNSLDRIREVGHLVSESKAFKGMIDHHPQPTEFADFVFHDDKASSTAEMIYRLIVELNDENTIDQDIATCLYTGIMTDTGSFRFNNTTADVHRIAGELLKHDINHASIHDRIYNSFSLKRMRMFGHTLFNRLNVMSEFNVSYQYISHADAMQFEMETGDSEGLVNFGLQISGVRMTALFTDQRNLIKISFRSIGDVDVNKFARKYFEGGGHKNAAGGRSKDTLYETLNRFRAAVEEYSKELTK